MDAGGNRPADLIRQLVQSIEGGPEQGFRDHAPVNRFAIGASEQLEHEGPHMRGTLGSSRRSSSRRARWRGADHARIVAGIY